MGELAVTPRLFYDKVILGVEQRVAVAAVEKAVHLLKVVLVQPFKILVVTGALASKFRNAGQTCLCASRILAQDGIYVAFMGSIR